MLFTHKSAVQLPTAPCPFQNLAGTLVIITTWLWRRRRRTVASVRNATEEG